MDEIFKAIRAACSPLVWSRGVELARENNVVGERLSDDEMVLRVSTPERTVSATVKLYPEDEDWMCDCGQPPTKPCEHIAAAIIACRRAREQGKALPVSAISRGVVTYHFTRTPTGLALERKIRHGEGQIAPLVGSLVSGKSNPPVNATKEDMSIDTMVGSNKGPLGPLLLGEVLTRLRDSAEVTLDGESLRVGEPTPGVKVVVDDAEGGGIRLALAPLDGVTESFANGAVLHAGRLRPRRALERDPSRAYSMTEIAEVASNILPALGRDLQVDVRTRRLPVVGTDSRPRLLFQTSSGGDVMSVLPLIVYGNPPYARIDAGKLVLLGDGNVIPDRNKGAEARLATELQSEFGFTVGKRLEFRGEAATRFAQRLRESKYSVGGEGASSFGGAPLEARLLVSPERMSVVFRLPNGEMADPERVFAAWREGLSRVPLMGGEGWAPIPKEWLERYGHRVLDLLAARGDGETPAHLKPEIARLCEELETPAPPEFARLRKSLETFAGIPSITLPRDLTVSLRPYQKRGVDWLSFLKSAGLGALLADDMGLGKTLQTLCVLSERTLVVCPTSVLPNWQREIARFRPSMKVATYHGSDRVLDPAADITLTTYAILRLDVEKLVDEEWHTIVLDEAQMIKNPESQVAQAACRLPAQFRVALTGTPVENRLEDLWSLFQFLDRGLLGGRTGFESRYAPAELRAKIRPFLLRRLKREVAPELPPRTDLVLYAELETGERTTYDAVRAAARTEVLEALAAGGSVLAALEALLRLRQAACHPGLLPGGAAAADSSKVRLLRDKLDEVVAEGHKALVFSQWTSLLDLIEPHLKFKFTRIDGTTKDRGAVVQEFQRDDGPPVLLMTLKAGGVGLNLTAADHVFLVDPWWNPAAEDQAADRAHRIGQDRPVFVHRLVAKDTVEEKILALQDTKRAAAAVALGGANTSGAITRDELLSLIS